MDGERKAKCGCRVERAIGGAWVVTASAFLCPARHNQGDQLEDEHAPDAE